MNAINKCNATEIIVNKKIDQSQMNIYKLANHK